jgi:RNA polymerase sigma-54 factor
MPDISLKLQLKAKVTQLQQLTVKLLSLHAQDLTDYIHEQVTDNPLIDIRYHDVRSTSGTGNEKPIDNIRSRDKSLEDVLMEQLRVLTLPKPVMLAAAMVIQSLDEKGFFVGDLDLLGQDYGLPEALMKEGLATVQSFDPPGIGATSLCDSLIIQTRRRPDAPPHTLDLLTAHYEDFLKGRWQRLQKELGITNQELKAIRDFMKTLSLQPAGQVDQPAEYVRADAELYIDENDKMAVRLLEEVPDIFFRDDLYASYSKEKDKKTLSYVKKARRAFLDLQTALAYRQRSVLLVLTEIAHRQEPYFRSGQALLPLNQKELAQLTGLSEATVSRVCRDRYVLFQQQIYPVQHFFAQAYVQQQSDSDIPVYVSDQVVREKIARLIQEEDGAHPYSDQEIAEHLQGERIHIARRTVAKFRMELGFVNSNMRRRMR